MQVTRLLAVGAIVGTVGIAFLAAGGWLSPHAVTPKRVVDSLEQNNGLHEGFRRNHSKGMGILGTFTSNGNGQRLSKAVVFRPGTVPVTGRFAIANGMPYGADDVKQVRSMALRFELPNGEEWRTGMNDIPVFVVRSGEEFMGLQVATTPDPATGKPDGARIKAFMESHPATAHAVGVVGARSQSVGFGNDTYNSLNTFLLVAEDGTITPVRWSMVSVTPAEATDAGPPSAPLAPNALFDAVIHAVHEHPLAWHLVMTLAKPGDPLDDPTVQWPPDREQVEVGTLTIDRVESEEGNEVRIINFDPLVLPNGIKPSNDPVLSARSAAYAQSLRRRLSEPVPSSAVGTREVTP